MNWEKIIDWDMDATLWLNNCLHGNFSDQLMVFMSDIVIWVPLYSIVVVLLFKELGWKRALIACLATGMVLVCCDQTANFIKDTAVRLRPCYTERMVSGGLRMLEKRGGMFGFFSGHAANSFGFATCVLTCLRNGNGANKKYPVLVVLGVLWAALLSLSRVAVGKHFLGDVVVGALFGTLVGYLLGLLFRFIASRITPNPTA